MGLFDCQIVLRLFANSEKKCDRFQFPGNFTTRMPYWGPTLSWQLAEKLPQKNETAAFLCGQMNRGESLATIAALRALHPAYLFPQNDLASFPVADKIEEVAVASKTFAEFSADEARGPSGPRVQNNQHPDRLTKSLSGGGCPGGSCTGCSAEAQRGCTSHCDSCGPAAPCCQIPKTRCRRNRPAHLVVCAARLATFCPSHYWARAVLRTMVHWLVDAKAILLNCNCAPSPFRAFVLRMLSIPSLSFMRGFSFVFIIGFPKRFSPWGMQVADAPASDCSDPFRLAKVHFGMPYTSQS